MVVFFEYCIIGNDYFGNGCNFVNGWTDAPNAATAVSTRVLKPNVAIWMAVVMNFLGALVMTF